VEKEEILARGADLLGISLESEQIDTLIRYSQEVQRWNQRIRLTSIQDEREFMIKHCLDSLAYAKGFVPLTGMRVMDVGAGAGFPGVPLKIWFPPMSLILVDASHKKTAFLQHIIRTLGLKDVSVVTERVEALPAHHSQIAQIEMMDLIVTRALSATEKIARWVEPLLKKDGRLLISKGPDILREKRAFEDKVPLGGMFVREILSFTLPFSTYQRNLVILQKGS
jgi:16S rRNA (guanine527-N7)-methyltransferase